MGDRALVIFWNRNRPEDVSPTVYLHWGGSNVPKLLAETCKHMSDRPGDVSYTAARFIGKCHAADSESALSLGVWNTTLGLDEIRKRPDEFSHGDSGVWLVDVAQSTWSIETMGGYGFGGDGDEPQTKRLLPAGEIENAP